MTIQLKYCALEYTPTGCRVRFPDGAECESEPHDTHHYYVIAHRLGYQDDLMAYCREHEFAHAFMSERLLDKPSQVLWKLAHGEEFNDQVYLFEEIAAQLLQRWLRAHERPILSGADWDGMKSQALALLDQEAP